MKDHQTSATESASSHGDERTASRPAIVAVPSTPQRPTIDTLLDGLLRSLAAQIARTYVDEADTGETT